MHVGMRIPPMGREMGLEGIIQWAAENGLAAIDLPEVNAEIRAVCDNVGIRIGTVDWGAGGGVLSKDASAREEAATAMKQRIRAVARTRFRGDFSVSGARRPVAGTRRDI